MKIQYDKNKLDRCVSKIEEEKQVTCEKRPRLRSACACFFSKQHAGLGLCI